MSNRGSEKLSDFKLIGGPIKLTERPPSSSHSSVSKKLHFTKFSSRPSSAVPRLCSGGRSQDETISAKNDRRPFSADFVITNTLSGKSKETLTDGSFESIYVPVDLQLPSSNLFKELLEEDIDQWRNFEMNGKTLSEQSTPTLVMSDSERSHNHDTPKREKSRSENIAEGNEIINNTADTCEPKTPQEHSIRSDDSTKNQAIDENRGLKLLVQKENLPEDKYIMMPGLTSKPPLPRKACHNTASLEAERVKEDPIYDYFAIKYGMEFGNNPEELEREGKPLRVIASEDADNHFDARSVEVIDELAKKQREEEYADKAQVEERDEKVENEKQNIRRMYFDKNNTETDTDSTVNDWLEEVNLNHIQKKESETDKYLKEVRKQCQPPKNDKNPNGIPLLSEMDIDDLFKLDDNGESSDKSDTPKVFTENSTLPHSDGMTDTEKKFVSRKRNTSKSSVYKKPQCTKNFNNNKLSSEKQEKESSITNKIKFTPMKYNTIKSPKHKLQTMEDNVETWIEKDHEKIKKNRLEFSELIDSVEELKSTTEMYQNSISTCNTAIPEDLKQENCDDIETIIEALENQGKKSQKKIQNIKRMVTSELSNSMILNDSEENLLYRKYDGKFETRETEKHSRSRSNSENSNNQDSSSRSEATRSMESKKRSKQPSESRDSTRSQCGEAGYAEYLKGRDQYKNLLSYLDEEDKKCHETLEVAKERVYTASKSAPESSGLFDTIPKVEDLVSLTPEELSSFIIELSLRVKNKTSCINLLQSELASLREKLLTQSKQAESLLRQKLKEQKEETETIAKRHQKFIDQLMEEKKTMARKCEELVEEMHNMEDKYVANMKAIEHRHQVEMQKMKDMHAASEKLRRERWIEGRTQKIKEMAVKSIEPEVERMEKRHQEELSNLRMVHKREIEELELRAARKLQEHSENLREQLIADREKALAHERDIMRLRYEKLVESEERNYQEQRRRLQADHSKRLAECEDREAQVAAEKERAVKQAQEEFEEKLQAAARRHANEMKIVKETAAIEMENWKNSFRKQQSALLMEKETAIRRECKKERDKEIELVIEKLENEASKARTQIEQTAENRIKRLKEKYEMEMRDLEMLEKDAQTKYCESRTKMLEYEEVMITLRNTIKQLEQQLTEEKVRRSKLEDEREGVREEVRKQYEDKMRSLEREAEELRSSADKQVDQLYSRVRVSLARKDELLAELTSDYKALKEKCQYLENMMEQQRKEYMINS